MRDDCYIRATIVGTINMPAINNNRDILTTWAKCGKISLIKLSGNGMGFSSLCICF